MSELVLFCGGAFVAGMVDAIVGGGGLIQIPLLFSGLPGALPATLFGTNKLSSVFGTGFAAWRFGRSVSVPWKMALPAATAAFGASYAGAVTVAMLPKDLLRPLVLALLVAVAIYTFVHKDFGSRDAGRIHGHRDMAVAVALGGGIGFYDGFFGPGAGSFLLFLFVRFLAWDFVRASAAAKIVNVATNLAALLYFFPSGNVIVRLGMAMAAFNVMGSLVGSHLALRHGSAFVRSVFLVVVSVLIGKFAYDTFS